MMRLLRGIHISRRTGIVLAVCLLPCFVSAAERKSPLQSQLESELLGKDFETRVVFGISAGPECVDTEVSPYGAVAYFARVGGFQCTYEGRLLGHVEAEALRGRLPVGTTLRVTKVDFRGDRIEVSLRGGYAKLKLMLGRGFESSYNLDAVLGVVSRALRLERFERLQFLKAEYPQLKAKLASAEAGFKSAQGDAPTRLAAARQLQQVLGGLVKNRANYDSLTQTLADPEEEQYARQAADLDKTVQALQQDARKQRAEEIRNALKSEGEGAAQLKSQLQAKPSTVAEWERGMDLLKRFDENAARRQALLQEMAQLGEPPSTEESAAIQNDLEAGQKVRAALESQRRALDLADLDARYREMDRNRKHLLDNYTRAFGTPKQRAEGQKLALHLHQMYENRTAADHLGSDQAKGQAATLQKDIERLTRQIGQVQFPSN